MPINIDSNTRYYAKEAKGREKLDLGHYLLITQDAEAKETRKGHKAI